jgi:hypothetical protein
LEDASRKDSPTIVEEYMDNEFETPMFLIESSIRSIRYFSMAYLLLPKSRPKPLLI